MNGILLIDKEKNYTSRDVVNIVAKEFNTKKVGHTGTLDPLATGVLVLTIGEATKISELLVSTYKEYEAEITLGIKTDTYDITGNVLEEKEVKLDKNILLNTLNKFQTRYMQEVPVYSAVKVNGKKLYEYAREGIEVALPKREVEIGEIELLSLNLDEHEESNENKQAYNKDINNYYQCIEFCRRYYNNVYHKDIGTVNGYAKNLYSLAPGKNLASYANGNSSTTGAPRPGDILVLDGGHVNPDTGISYGHVAVIMQVGSGFIKIAQQNSGVGNPSSTNWNNPIGGQLSRNGNTISAPANTTYSVLGWVRIIEQ